MEKATSEVTYPLQFFDDFIGHVLEIECCSWEYEFAARIWGPNLAGKTTKGVIKKVSYNRKTKKPKFEVFVADTKETYTKLDLDYILKYSNEVPLKYHELKAEFIVRLSRNAGHIWMPKGQLKEDTLMPEKPVRDEETEEACNNDSPANALQEPTPLPKKNKSRTDAASKGKGKAPKRGVSSDNNDDNFVEESKSDVEEDDLGEEFWDAIEREEDEDDQEGIEEDDIDQDFIQWQRDTPPVQPPTAFTGAPGPKHTLSPENAVPFDYFSLYIPIYFWSRIAQYTNSKAEMTKEKQDGKIRDWSTTCAGEIKAWFASVMWWCLSKNCSFEQFHKNVVNPSLCSKWFPSLRRWQQIKRFLKISDPTKDEENKNNRMFKVQELYDIFIAACKANFYPNREVSVDEAVKKFKGRCLFKQYIKGKPVRFGIKIFCLCCSATSYLFNAMFYIGKSDIPTPKEASITQDTVVQLMQPLAGKHHRVYMDNYYTGLPLFKELNSMQILATGTVRTNRKGLDPYVTVKKTEETILKKNPGSTRFSSCGRYVYASWFDKRAVHMLSNCHQPVAGPEDVLEHWYPAKAGDQDVIRGKVRKQISISPIVRWYRKWMGGVDRFDQYRAYIKLEMRTGKFWFPMMWFLLESALVNAWIVYKATRELAGLPLQFTNFEFRVAIARSLAAEWESMGCAFMSSNSQFSPSDALKTTSARKLSALFGADKCTASSVEDYHLSFVENIPLLDGQKVKKRRQIRCLATGCESRTSKWCRACHAPLCYPDCFITYHKN